MYRLMKSQKYTVDHAISGVMSSYRHTQVDHFRQFRPALAACEAANNEERSCCYVLNVAGQEYYDGTWID